MQTEKHMSTSYRLEEHIPAVDVLDGRLMVFGVREQVNEHTNEAVKCLTDGRNCVWLYTDDDGFVSSLSSYRANVPSKILRAIATVFETQIFSEYEPQFWGFDSNEAWDAAMEQMDKEDDDRFYAELIKYLRGEPSDINPHTVGQTQAVIARKLTDENHELLIPEMRKTLMTAIEKIYESHHVVEVKLTKQDLAFNQMLATHEDDMGQARTIDRAYLS
jgi:hypothetical protein